MDQVLAGVTKRSSKKIFLVIEIILLFFIFSAASFYGGMYFSNKKVEVAEARAKALTHLNDPANPFFVNLKGSLYGKITKIDKEKAYVESSKGGERGIFNIINPVEVIEVKQGKLNTIGTTIDKVILNENADIRVTGFEEGYVIYSVVYNRDPALELNTKEASTNATVKKPIN